jgi:hypothetical protein
LRSAAELSARYLHDRHLPDKAIDVIDEAGAGQKLLPTSRRTKVIGVGEIETIIGFGSEVSVKRPLRALVRARARWPR